jgi:hypothetical protein
MHTLRRNLLLKHSYHFHVIPLIILKGLSLHHLKTMMLVHKPTKKGCRAQMRNDVMMARMLVSDLIN